MEEALAILQALYGGYQIYNAFQASKKTATYTIPEAAKTQLNQAQLLAGDKKLPGQDALEEKIQENTASALKTAKEIGTPAQILSTLSKLTAKSNDAERSLGVAAAQNWQGNQKNLTNALGKFAGYEDKEFQINQEQPYLAAQKKSTDLMAGGSQNIFSALSNVAGANEENDKWSNYLDAITGTGKYAKKTGVSTTTPNISTTTPDASTNYLMSFLTGRKNKSLNIADWNKYDWSNLFQDRDLENISKYQVNP